VSDRLLTSHQLFEYKDLKLRIPNDSVAKERNNNNG
jgi:hypothetical protein